MQPLFFVLESCSWKKNWLLRSVGKRDREYTATGGIMGVTFTNGVRKNREMYEAMVCRGFEGTYRKKHHFSFSVWDGAAIAFALAITALFVYLA